MINKIEVDTITHDINDARIPEELGTAGQVLMVNETGDGMKFSNAGGGKLYQHNIQFLTPPSIGDVTNSTYYITLITSSNTPFTQQTFLTYLINNKIDVSNKGLPLCNIGFILKDNVPIIFMPVRLGFSGSQIAVLANIITLNNYNKTSSYYIINFNNDFVIEI